MARAVVELRGCTRDFGAVRAVDALDLAVHEGELLSLLGPSGCGKTTTLNLIAGFVAPSAGRVIVDGQDVTARPPHERGLGVVFQSYALFPHMSVFENVAFGLRERRVAKSEIGRRVDEALALVRLQGQGERRPRQLSGGMQQRAALARALVYAPRVLLLDEPLAALDRKLREEMRAELREILREVGITTVFVTHDQSEALSLSDRIAVMNQGRIEQLGPPRDVYQRPATRFVADFIGGSSRLRGRASARDRVDLGSGVSVQVRLGRPLQIGEDVELGIRPERVAVTPHGAAGGSGANRLAGRITRLTYLGAQTEVGVEIAGGQFLLGLVAEPSPAPLVVGGEVALDLSPDAFLLL
jgi:spermidine/putrescine ABC transporter ATP-binding subunit